jgi:tRNA dimethylallyltransferase
MDQPLLTVPLPTSSSLTESNTSVPYLIVVCGATATGKSGLAIALAKRLRETKRVDPAILSADSRQVYREFNIGTAKPSIAEQQQVPHYLIDICDPTETLTVAEYQEKAQALIGGGKTEGRRQEAEGNGGESGAAAVSSQQSETNSKLKTSPTPYSLLPTPFLLVGGTDCTSKRSSVG